MYLGRRVGFFRSSVEFAVRVEGELARAEGEYILRKEGEYCKGMKSKGLLAIGAHYILCVRKMRLYGF